MEFKIQDPAWVGSAYLLEEIIDASAEADSGGACFCFASPGGIRLLFQDPSFRAFLSRSNFELVVGVDAVTNAVALERLGEQMQLHPKLDVNVYHDPGTPSLFHQKVCWFSGPDGGRWIVGSGNLTPGGLRGNVEAFTVSRSAPTDHVSMEAMWRSWKSFHNVRLFKVDDQTVVDRAQQNSGREVPEGLLKGLAQELLSESNTGDVAVTGRPADEQPVLLAEIPNAGERWKQANFNLETFTEFFGAEPGRTHRVLLTHVNVDGSLGREEVRPSVTVASRNFRFELDAATGIPYPSRGRPIGIFLRLGTRTFRYHLLLPGATNYEVVSSALRSLTVDRSGRMRRVVITAGALRRIWPSCPVLFAS